jgi:carbon-monoxide dehydrogenase catalytic subunit
METTGTRDSLHGSVNAVLERTRAASEDTVFDRMQAQGERRCQFCEGGIRCSICSQGPCRITAKATRGVCGIDADGMAMRGFLLQNTMGAAAYTYHAGEVMKTLAQATPGGTYEIKDWSKLELLARGAGVELEPRDTLAKRVADTVWAEFNRDHHEESPLVTAFAPAPRVAAWRKLGVLPGGVLHENNRCTTSCMTNIDGDYVSLALKGLRLGLATAYGSQVPLELAQDALFGTPTPHAIKVDLGILDPTYVNVVVNGHEPMLGAALIDAAHAEAAQAAARAAGAKGLRIVGSIETGQELVQRFTVDDVFVGLTGNWLATEMVVATGAVDVFAADMNCTVPTLADTCKAHGTLLIPVSDLMGIPGAEPAVVFDPAKAAEQAQQLIDRAIANYPARKARLNGNGATGLRTGDAVAGFSTESILAALGGSLDPLLDVIKNGTLRGVAGLVSCTTLRDSGQDSNTVAVARELIQHDVLVLSMGCGNAACQVAGLQDLKAKDLAGPGLRAVCDLLGIPPVLSFGTCTDTGRIMLLVGAIADALGVDVPALPVVATAPEYMEQKATIDAMAALAFGLYVHVNPVPFVTGAPRLLKLVTEDLPGVTGGKLAVETDPVEAVAAMLTHIDAKRTALGI